MYLRQKLKKLKLFKKISSKFENSNLIDHKLKIFHYMYLYCLKSAMSNQSCHNNKQTQNYPINYLINQKCINHLSRVYNFKDKNIKI